MWLPTPSQLLTFRSPEPLKGKRKEGKKEATTAKRGKLVISFDVANRIAKEVDRPICMWCNSTGRNDYSDPAMGSGTLLPDTDGDKPFTAKL